MKKTYKFKLSKAATILTVIIIALLAIYLVLTAIEIATSRQFNWIRTVCTIVFSIVLLYIIISIFKSKYIIEKSGLIISIGVSKFLVEMNKITNIEYLKVTNRLCLSYLAKSEIKHTVIQIDEADYFEFAKSLQEENPNILYEEIA